MAWDNSANAGFTSGTPWLKMGSRHKEINLERDLASDKSIFRFHKHLFALRREREELRQGEFIPLHKAEDNFAAYLRVLDGRSTCIVCNFDGERRIDLPEMQGRILLSNYGRQGGDEGVFRPYEIAVFGI